MPEDKDWTEQRENWTLPSVFLEHQTPSAKTAMSCRTHICLSLLTCLKKDYVSECAKRWYKKESKSSTSHPKVEQSPDLYVYQKAAYSPAKGQLQ